MDTATINKKGIAPLKPELDRINAMSNMPDVVAELVRLHRVGIGVLFNFGAQPDAKDSTRTIARLRPGRPLPARSRLLPEDRRQERRDSPALRRAREEDVPAGRRVRRKRRRGREAVLDFETILAKASIDRVSMRDPNKTLPHHDQAELAQLAPNFALGRVLSGDGRTGLRTRST